MKPLISFVGGALGRSRNDNGKVALELREFHFGKRPNVLRVIFTIDGPSVRVLRIRRAQRRLLTRRQIEDALRADQPADEDDEG